MEKIKVLHIITSLNIGGAERLVTDIALNNPRNITVTSLKYTNSHYLSELYEAEVRYNYLTKGSVYNPLLILKIIPLLKKYKIVHIHLFPTIYWVVFAKILSFSNVKLIYTEHNTDNRRRKYLIFQKLDQFIYSKLDFVGCISKKTEENLKKHLTERFNVPIETILNGVNLKKFSIKETDSADYNYFKPNDFILIQISSFRKQKDQITLIKCLKFLPENIKLLLVGAGDLLEDHKELVYKLGLNNRVKFLGIREDIPQLLKYSDVNILSSHYEGFGLVALEGMAMKIPTIASNVPGLTEVVEGAGLLFEKSNVKQLKEKILLLYNDNEFYETTAKKCYERSQQYNIELMINKYNYIYFKN